MASFMRFLNINTQLTPAPTSGNTSKQVLLFGQRNTGGAFIPATNGFTQPNYYVPFLLPSFSDGQSALQYLGNYGLQYQFGIDFTLSLPAPDTVITVNSLTTITWNTIPSDFAQLTEFALTGTLSQGLTNGDVYQASIIAGIATLTVFGTVAYVTAADSGAGMTLVGINNVAYPDPNATDPICLMVWDFYQTALSANSSANGAPAAYISILSNRDVTINPVSTPIVLIGPVTVGGTGSTITLTYPRTEAGIGYLPTTALGNTSVTQATSSATGIYGGYVVSGTNIIITVTNVTGTFDGTDTVSIILDNSVNAGAYLDGVNLYAAVQQFPITTLSDITTRYASFFNLITLLNQGNQVLNSHYFTYGMAGNIALLPNQAATLPAPNNQEYVLVTYPYVYKFGSIPYENTAMNVGAGRVTSAVAYMLANGDTPFPPLMGATINQLPVSPVYATTSYSGAQNGTGDIAVNQGWLPLAPNTQGLVQFLESNTTLITIPGTTTPDIEFRYTHIWDCVRWLKQQIAQLYTTISVLPNNQGSVLISPQFIRQFQNGILSILVTGENLGVIENLALYQNLVTVTQDPINPNQVDAYVPAQIIPQLNGANVLINVFSSLYQFPANQGA